VNRGDQTVERLADKVQELANRLGSSDGLASKLAQPLADDAVLLRKMKPSLIAARARGEAPTGQPPGSGTVVPSAPQLGERPKPPETGTGGPNPWVVVVAALALGIAVAKWIDWRGHAHPRD
jgi:hypothetical protein